MSILASQDVKWTFTWLPELQITEPKIVIHDFDIFLYFTKNSVMLFLLQGTMRMFKLSVYSEVLTFIPTYLQHQP